MSKIIKNSELICQPKIVNLADFQESKAAINTDRAGVIQEQQEQIDLEELRDESSRILDETEQMVLELLEKARNESNNIIASAQEEAEVMLAQANEEAKKIKELAHQEGYQSGLKQATREIEADRQAALEQNRLLIEEARQTKLAMIASCESDIVRLAIVLARKIVATEISTGADVVANTFKDAVAYLSQPENIRVYVNPADMEKVLELTKNDKVFDIGGKEKYFEVSADDRISPGGCVLESEAGTVDSRIETRISSAEKALLEVAGDE